MNPRFLYFVVDGFLVFRIQHIKQTVPSPFTEHGITTSAEAGAQLAFSHIHLAIISSLQLVHCLNLDLARRHQRFAARRFLPLLMCCCHR